MSLEIIAGFVREMVVTDDALTDSNNCRNSAIKIASEIKKVFPKSKISFLAFPEACEGTNVHYSVLVAWEGQKMVINTVMAPGFPEYIGDLSLAVPTFLAMKESDIVK
jgi:hypothetical protein